MNSRMGLVAVVAALQACGGAPSGVLEADRVEDAASDAADSAPNAQEAAAETGDPAEAGNAMPCAPPPSSRLDWLCSGSGITDIDSNGPVHFECGYAHFECDGMGYVGKGAAGFTALCHCEAGYCATNGMDYGACAN